MWVRDEDVKTLSKLDLRTELEALRVRVRRHMCIWIFVALSPSGRIYDAIMCNEGATQSNPREMFAPARIRNKYVYVLHGVVFERWHWLEYWVRNKLECSPLRTSDGTQHTQSESDGAKTTVWKILI